jgi:hypothetical protein
MKEGLIKDAYELILKEIQTIITILYLLMVGIGMLFNYKKYAKFKINIFEYADVFDFLIAPFQDNRIILVSVLATLVPLGLIWLDRFLRKRAPKLYQWVNLGLGNRSWYEKLKVLFFSGLLFYFIFEAANGYANFIANNTDFLQTISLKYTDDEQVEGKLIGKTKEVIFLLTDNKVKIIPLTSIVKEIEVE